MKIKRISAALAAAAVMLTSVSFADSADTAHLSESDFPEEEGINIIDDTTDFIELPDMPGELSEESKNETINISTVEDLETMHRNMLASAGYSQNKTFVLLNNIDLGGMEWTPIGYNSAHTNGTTSALLTYAFNGIFEGNGYTISNFKMTDNQFKYLGFFGSVAGGTVRNLNLERVTINHSYSVNDGAYGSVHFPEYNGLLVGFSNYATIENCNVSGSIKISNDTSYGSKYYLSTGLITGAGIAQITGCAAAGSITTNALVNTYSGGIFGNAGTSNTYFRGFIKDCSSSVKISSESSSPVYAGGIIGRSSTSIDEISDCKFTSSAAAKNVRASGGITTDMPAYAGGIVGYSYTPVIGCTSGSGEISASSESAPNAGGIAGRAAHRIERCTVDNKIVSDLPSSSSTGTAAIGGIAGICGLTYSSSESLAPPEEEDIASVTDCIVSSKATLTCSSGSSGFIVSGGIAGTVYAPSTIRNCASSVGSPKLTATMSGIYYGGIAGYLNGGAVEYCTADGGLIENTSSASTLYIGGIAGIARTKRFFTYDMRYGVQSSEFVTTMVYGSHIDSCSADVSIAPASQSAQYIGGIAGYVSGIYSSTTLHVNMDRDLVTERSRFTGDITIGENSGTCHAGGISGYALDGAFRNCYAAGNIESLARDEKDRVIGGGVGTLKQANHDIKVPIASVQNSYAFMSVTKPDGIDKTVTAPFCAELSASATSGVEPAVSGCFCSEEGGGIASRLDADAFREQSSFGGWDFDRVWTMGTIRPLLRFEENTLYDAADCTGDHVGTLIISRPKDGQMIAAAAKDAEGRVTDARAGRVTNSKLPFAFAELDFDIPAEAESCDLYFWGKNNEPLADVSSAAVFAGRFQ